MKRNIIKLANTTFDLLVIGGGIHGVVLAWQAALCGLSVGLIEKGDFAQGTSFNSQKIIHGGLRYLQNLNIARMLQSIWARRQLMMLAPHLVHPLMCLMPVYGHGFKGKEMMWLGLRINDLIGANRNSLSDRSKNIPNGKLLSTSKINNLIPNLEQDNLKGSSQWYDAICLNTERLVLGFVKTADRMGAVVANYVKATGIIQSRNKIEGIKCLDQITGDTFDIRANGVANCTGPWVNELLPDSIKCNNPQTFVSGINIIVKKLFPLNSAIGIKNKTGKSRLYFIVPWREKTIVGTEYSIYHGCPDEYRGSENECMQLIRGFNQAYPFAQLKLDDVTFIHNGLLPVDDKNNIKSGEQSISKKFRILDHKLDGIDRFISIIGVKYTTAGYVSAKALKYLFPELSNAIVNSKQRLIGGEIDDFLLFRKEIIRRWENKIDVEILAQLIGNYGTEIESILGIGGLQISSASKQGDPSSSILKGQTLFAIQDEMAIKLTDVILRRTDIGTVKRPEKDMLNQISHVMADELEWTEDRRKAEIQDVNDFYPSFIM